MTDELTLDERETMLAAAEQADALIAAEWLLDSLHVPTLVADPITLPDNIPDATPDPLWRLADEPNCPVRWRRLCDQCNTFQPPVEGVQVPRPTIDRWNEDPRVLTDLVRCQVCSGCRTPYPGPRMVAQWVKDPTRYVYGLRLAAGDGYVKGALYGGCASPEIDHSWRHMELELLDRLTYRESCHVRDCTTTARAGFIVKRPDAPASMLGIWLTVGKRFKLCPEHQSELMRDVDLRW